MPKKKIKNRFRTEQEKFWAGQFGDEYIARNQGAERIASNTALFTRVLSRTRNVRSVIEFGANIGLNLEAIRRVLPNAALAAVEINQKAACQLKRSLRSVDVCPVSIVDYKVNRTYDLALVKGVLIHINPEILSRVYERLYRASSRYICIAEYYNPSPVAISYRGHADRLFKRDFAGEMLDKYRGLRLVDYGFCYRRDVNFPQDDLSWFLLEKT